MEMILEFLRDVLSQPALLIGIMSCVGLIALKRPFHKIMTGTCLLYTSDAADE